MQSSKVLLLQCYSLGLYSGSHFTLRSGVLSLVYAVCYYFDYQLIISVIFKQNYQTFTTFSLVSSEDLLLYFVLCNKKTA